MIAHAWLLPPLLGGSQICGQSAPPGKGTNGKKLKILNFKFACISDPAANTMQTAVSSYSRIHGQPTKELILIRSWT